MLKRKSVSHARPKVAERARVQKSSTRSQIDPSAIAWAPSFIKRFDIPERRFAELRGLEKQADGSITFPWHEYANDVQEFVTGLYQKRLAVEFDWGKWKRGERLFTNPGLIAASSVEDCLKLLTLCVRKDRFCDGFLREALETGVVLACLKRLRDLFQQQSGEK